ncbi:hypothetical protein NE681_18200, partial [Faecalibacillus intestinalis]|nr:hypothetical protein [Faecalibacillus intestinalis]
MLVLFISKNSKQLAVFQLLRSIAKLAITLFNSHNQLILINVLLTSRFAGNGFDDISLNVTH